jgi:hypothetical protein
LAGYSTETVGQGASLSAGGFPNPTLTSQVPVGSTANAIVSGNIQYVIEVVPNNGATSPSPVLVGVNSIGSISINTTGTPNDAGLFSLVQLQLSSDLTGDAVFNDVASIVYNASLTGSGGCTTSNDSTAHGVATVSVSVNCGGSSASGGFDETGSYSIFTNEPFLVTLNADLNLGTDNGSNLNPEFLKGGTVEGLATVDPVFTVPNGFTLEISPGAGDSPAVSEVPEPASLALLGTALAGFCFLRRRRNRTAA